MIFYNKHEMLLQLNKLYKGTVAFFPLINTTHESCLKLNSKFSEFIDGIIFLVSHHMGPCCCFLIAVLKHYLKMHCYIIFCANDNQLEYKFFVIREDILHIILRSCPKPHSLLTHSFLEQIFIEFLLAIKSWLGPRDMALYPIRHDLSLKVCRKEAPNKTLPALWVLQKGYCHVLCRYLQGEPLEISVDVGLKRLGFYIHLLR